MATFLAPWSLSRVGGTDHVVNLITQSFGDDVRINSTSMHYAPSLANGQPDKGLCMVIVESNAAVQAEIAQLAPVELFPDFDTVRDAMDVEVKRIIDALSGGGISLRKSEFQDRADLSNEVALAIHPAFKSFGGGAIAEPSGTFTDDFEGEGSNTDLKNHTPSGGTSWTKTGGDDSGTNGMIVRTDGLVRARNAGTDSHYIIAPDQGSADQYAQSSIRLDATDESGIACRLVDSDNCILHYFAGTGAAGSRLAKIVTATVTDLITAQGVDFNTYRIECVGDTIKLFDNGSQVGSDQTVSDHNTETSQGLICRGETGTGSWEDFEAGSLAAGGATPKGPLGHPLHGPFGGPIG